MDLDLMMDELGLHDFTTVIVVRDKYPWQAAVGTTSTRRRDLPERPNENLKPKPQDNRGL